jgi:hypothetical protein
LINSCECLRFGLIFLSFCWDLGHCHSIKDGIAPSLAMTTSLGGSSSATFLGFYAFLCSQQCCHNLVVAVY